MKDYAVIYTGTLSSGGKQVTTSMNQTVNIQLPSNPTYEVNAVTLVVEAFATSLHISLNGESTIHEVDPNSSITFSGIIVNSFVIQENNAEYRWTAMY